MSELTVIRESAAGKCAMQAVAAERLAHKVLQDHDGEDSTTKVLRRDWRLANNALIDARTAVSQEFEFQTACIVMRLTTDKLLDKLFGSLSWPVKVYIPPE